MHCPTPRAKRRLGFTLIELIISVSIVAILTGVSLVIIKPAAIRAKARDSRRSNAILSIQTALELYYTQNSRYPCTGNSGLCTGTINWQAITTTSSVYSALKPAFIRNLELDPIQSASPRADPCRFSTNYRFNYKSDGTYYLLTAQMENLSSASGSKCLDLSQWDNSDCVEINNNCYGVENGAL